MGAFEKLHETKQLYDQGIITEEEYQKIKNRLLDEMISEPSTEDEFRTTAATTPEPTSAQVINTEPVLNASVNNGATTGMKVLSFLFPIVGLILFLMDREKKPEAARDELKWAGIGFGIGILGYVLLVAMGSCSGSYY